MEKENGTKTVVPALRFPEFRGAKGWEEKKLTSLCDITNGKCNAQDHIEGGKYPLFDRSAVVKYSNNYLYDCEAIIIPGEGVKFVPKYYNGKFNLHQRAYALKDFSCNGKFLFYDMEYHSGLLAVKAVKSTVLSLRLPILQNFPLHIPFEDIEQQKIADCLSSLDDLIEATNRKIEALKEHKKGLMQRLFPKERENVPELRFPEFQGTKEWEKKKLEEIGNFIGGGTPNTNNPEYWDGEILWYTPTEIKNTRLKSSNRKITEQGLRNSSAKLLPKGAILITTRATIGDVAISEKECTTNQGFQSLVVKDSEVNSFWFYWITQHKEELIKRASGSTFKEIGKNEIINITAYSTKKQEQQKIADCLSSLDELIEATSQKVEILKEHKKGLMQQLFPKI